MENAEVGRWNVLRLVDRMTDQEKVRLSTRSEDGHVARVDRTLAGAYDFVLELPSDGPERIASDELRYRIDQQEASTTQVLQDLEDLVRDLDPSNTDDYVEIEPKRARFRLAADRDAGNENSTLAQMLGGRDLLIRYENQRGEEVYVSIGLSNFRAAFQEAFGGTR